MKKTTVTLIFLIIIACILTNSQISLLYAFQGLDLWFHKMIPTLFPFMVLSGIMIRLRLTEGFVMFLYPVIKGLLKISPNVCYAIVMGFLCGFPMGAKSVRDLYHAKLLSLREAEFVLAFSNNIGPVYFCGFVIPLLNRKILVPYLIGMYGLPILYGIFLRYTSYHDLSYHDKSLESRSNKNEQGSFIMQIITAADESIGASILSILNLGGYMIVFNLLNMIPHIITGRQPYLIAPLFEITGGLAMLKSIHPLYTLLLLPFGGLCCIVQTFSTIRDTPLSIADYFIHKLKLTGMTGIYYCVWYLVWPDCFLI